MKAKLCLVLSSLLICLGTTRLRAQAGADVGAQVVKAQDTKGTPDERADQLAAEMTFAEKVSLLSGARAVTAPARFRGWASRGSLCPMAPTACATCRQA